MSSNNLNPIGQEKELSAKEAFIPHQADLSLANFWELYTILAKKKGGVSSAHCYFLTGVIFRFTSSSK